MKAVKSDGYIQNLVQQNAAGLELLGGDEVKSILISEYFFQVIIIDSFSQQTLLSALPSDTVTPGVSLATLKQQLKALDDLIFSREQLFSKFQEEVKQVHLAILLELTPLETNCGSACRFQRI